MTKIIVNNRTDAWKTDINLFFTSKSCQIVHSHSPYTVFCKYIALNRTLGLSASRISLLKMIWCTTPDQLMKWHFLATRAGKIAFSWPFGTTRWVPQEQPHNLTWVPNWNFMFILWKARWVVIECRTGSEWWLAEKSYVSSTFESKSRWIMY